MLNNLLARTYQLRKMHKPFLLHLSMDYQVKTISKTLTARSVADVKQHVIRRKELFVCVDFQAFIQLTI